MLKKKVRKISGKTDVSETICGNEEKFLLLLKEWETDTEVGKKREKENVDGRFFFFFCQFIFISE